MGASFLFDFEMPIWQILQAIGNMHMQNATIMLQNCNLHIKNKFL